MKTERSETDPKLETRNLKLETKKWFALYTRARFEKRVATELTDKGLESYLPYHTVVRQWSDRKKKIDVPLFSCYVFVRIPLSQRLLAIQTDGVVRMVSFNGTPSPIPDEEIDAVRRVLEGSASFEATNYIPIGRRVEVIRGPLAGIRGRLIEQRGQKKVLVGIEQIRQAISVEVNDSDVRPVAAPNSDSRPSSTFTHGMAHYRAQFEKKRF